MWSPKSALSNTKRHSTDAPTKQVATMSASSWDTYLASKKLLQEHGSVAGVKAALSASPGLVAPLTAGLDAWKDLPAAMSAAASQVDIVIPVRAPGPCAECSGEGTSPGPRGHDPALPAA